MESRIATKPLILHEAYFDNNRHLTITISDIDGFGSTSYQKDETIPAEYLAGGVVHYIIENNNEFIVVWYTEKYSVLITGSISRREMERIINSVYEVR